MLLSYNHTHTNLEIQLLWSTAGQHNLVRTAPCSQLHTPGLIQSCSDLHMKSRIILSSSELFHSNKMHIQSYKKQSKTDDKPDAEATVTTACNKNCTVCKTGKKKKIHLILSKP